MIIKLILHLYILTFSVTTFNALLVVKHALFIYFLLFKYFCGCYIWSVSDINVIPYFAPVAMEAAKKLTGKFR